jgi:tetratricopeptide (TPR) repeat protein
MISFTFISALLLGIAVYYKYLTYRSLVIQSIIAQDDFPNTAVHSWKEINDQLPDVPNLAVVANSPIDVIKAWYLSKDARYDEAMILLDKSTKVNPYNMANEYVKAQIFYQMNKLDSAFYYASKGFYTRPANIGYYGLLTDICKARKDTLAIKKAFKACIKHRSEVANVWNKYIGVLLSLNYNQDYLLAVAGSAEKLFPNDKSILKNKFIINATLASNAGYIKTLLSNSLKIVEIDPQDYAYLENIGACYFMLKQYDLAIPYLDKVIAAKAFGNGKSEYIKGLCLVNLNKPKEACSFFKVADSRNFLGAKKLVDTYCK